MASPGTLVAQNYSFSFVSGILVVTPGSPATCGVYDPANAQFYLSTQNDFGGVMAPFGFGGRNWKPLAGDWDGDGKDTIGAFNPTVNQFYLRNSNDTGMSDVSFPYGTLNSGQVTIMGDWDGDGKETVGLYTPKISFFELRNSPGGGMSEIALGFGAPRSDAFFDPKIYGTGGATPQSVVTGDFNKDGKIDVALTNADSNTLSVLLGDGTGGMGTATTYSTGGTSPQSLVAADFNGDGYLDLAVTNRGSNKIGILLGSATGFAAATTFSIGGTAPYGIVSGDFNGDGKIDLAVTNRTSGNVAISLGDGAGGFGSAATFSTGGTSPQTIVTGDFNADGKLDVAAANAGSNNISVLLGNGAGRLGSATRFSSGGSMPNALAVGDFDRDGKLDLAVSNAATAAGIGILRGTGTGSFNKATMYSSGAANPSAIIAGDFNDDGMLDLAAIHSGNRVAVMYANVAGGTITFPTIKTFGSGGTASFLAAADFSGDGKLDLAVANADATGTVGVLLNYRWEPVVGDWDGDGKDTIGLLNPMTGMFYLRNSLTTGIADIAFPYGVPQSGWQPLIGDWNGDGRDSAGFFIYNINHFFLRDDFTAGYADYSFAMGKANRSWRPIVGNWSGTAGQSLLAVDVPPPGSMNATPLDAHSIQPLFDAAVARWAEIGTNFGTIHVVVTDLPGGQLGAVMSQTIYLDTNAAVHGWFTDPTPAVNEEFTGIADTSELRATCARAVDGIDLLTVVEHELGHIASLQDLDNTLDSLMSARLFPGIRRFAAEIDAIFASRN